MALSYADIEGLWIQAGGSKASAPLAAAIATAESGGNPSAHNGNASTGDNSYGLWQINMIGALGPDRLKQFGISSNGQLLDPLTNAKAAVKVSAGGTDFSPWSTFKSGAYKQFVNGAVPPNLTAGGASGGTGAAPAQDASLVTDVVDPLEEFVMGMLNYFYFGILVTGGLILMGFALWGLMKETGTLKKDASVPGALLDMSILGMFRRRTPDLPMEE